MLAPQAGKGKGKRDNALNSIDASLKVWIGKLPEGMSKEELQAHFEQVGAVQVAEPMPRNTGCVAFNTAEEAQAAIDVLNGSVLGEATIEVDVWTTKPAGAGKGGASKGSYGKGKASYGKGMVQQPMFQKPMYAPMVKGGLRPGGMLGGKGMSKGYGAPVMAPMFGGKGKDFGKDFGKGKGKSKKGNPLKNIDNSLKVWVNNLPDLGHKWKSLEVHFDTVGKTQWVEVMPKGVACVAYSTTEDATAALTLNGVDFEGQVLEVDVWEQAPKKGA